MIARRSFFPDALDLYDVHVSAVGLPREDVDRWRASSRASDHDRRAGQHDGDAPGAPNGDEDVDEAAALGNDRRKPRRRRGGRGRARPHAE
jgi:hypothetical protein